MVIAQLATLVLGFITFGRTQKRQVSFEMEPVGKKEFERHAEENAKAFEQYQHELRATANLIAHHEEHRKKFDSHEAENRRTAEQLSNEIADIRRERKEDIRDLHEKVNGIAREVSQLSAKAEMQNQQTVLINQKLDNLISTNNENR